MIKRLIPALLIIAAATSGCTSLKPSGNSQVATPVRSTTNNSNTTKGNDIKFLDDISMTPRGAEPMEVVKRKETGTSVKGSGPNASIIGSSAASVEKASSLQLKYAVLLNTDVELLENTALLEHVDEWYGTRYRMGGTSKLGIDCSAFVQAVYLSAFAVSLPRTAREQFRTSRIISATELKEGDLVFFNTTGGISHVGIYLMNNKFVHASSSNGVTISDLFDPYYLKRYIGAGRISRSEVRVQE